MRERICDFNALGFVFETKQLVLEIVAQYLEIIGSIGVARGISIVRKGVVFTDVDVDMTSAEDFIDESLEEFPAEDGIGAEADAQAQGGFVELQPFVFASEFSQK